MSRRPSDAAIAAAFWQARKAINNTPPSLLSLADVQFMQRGDEMVREARIADWHMQLIRDATGGAA